MEENFQSSTFQTQKYCTMPLSVYFLDPGDIWLAKWYSNYVLNNQLFSEMLVATPRPTHVLQVKNKLKQNWVREALTEIKLPNLGHCPKDYNLPHTPFIWYILSLDNTSRWYSKNKK